MEFFDRSPLAGDRTQRATNPARRAHTAPINLRRTNCSSPIDICRGSYSAVIEDDHLRGDRTHAYWLCWAAPLLAVFGVGMVVLIVGRRARLALASFLVAFLLTGLGRGLFGYSVDLVTDLRRIGGSAQTNNKVQVPPLRATPRSFRRADSPRCADA